MSVGQATGLSRTGGSAVAVGVAASEKLDANRKCTNKEYEATAYAHKADMLMMTPYRGDAPSFFLLRFPIAFFQWRPEQPSMLKATVKQKRKLAP